MEQERRVGRHAAVALAAMVFAFIVSVAAGAQAEAVAATLAPGEGDLPGAPAPDQRLRIVGRGFAQRQAQNTRTVEAFALASALAAVGGTWFTRRRRRDDPNPWRRLRDAEGWRERRERGSSLPPRRAPPAMMPARARAEFETDDPFLRARPSVASAQVRQGDRVLLDRAGFLYRLEAVLALPDVARERVVLVIDLADGSGTKVPPTIIDRLLELTRAEDAVAHLHGDVFGVLLSRATDVAAAAALAERIETELRVPARVGIVGRLERYASAEHIMRDADVAMDEPGPTDRSGPVLLDDAMRMRGDVHSRLARELRSAVERDELHVHYQPTVDLRSGATTGFEAIVRWSHPTLGRIASDELADVEESEATIAVARLALREACAAVARLDRVGATALGASVAITPGQFARADVVADIRTALADSAVAPERLTLCIGTRALLANNEHAHDILRDLRTLGVLVCIDDLGSGPASLECLHEFPFDALKIDGASASATGTLADAPVVHILLNLARRLELTSVVTGIQSESERRGLVALGAQVGQGPLFSRPLAKAAFVAWLRERREVASDAPSAFAFKEAG